MSEHCPGCEDSGFEDCPGVTCAACAEKDAEIDRLRALVAVGQLIVDANEIWPGKTVQTEEWRRLEQKWRRLEGGR